MWALTCAISCCPQGVTNKTTRENWTEIVCNNCDTSGSNCSSSSSSGRHAWSNGLANLTKDSGCDAGGCATVIGFVAVPLVVYVLKRQASIADVARLTLRTGRAVGTLLESSKNLTRKREIRGCRRAGRTTSEDERRWSLLTSVKVR